jgi:hypothetical protein
VQGLSIAVATAQLGINPLALIWERSALVLLLIFLSGWFRDEQVKQGETDETPAAINDDTMQLILARLAKLDQLEQALNRQTFVEQMESETPIAIAETDETACLQAQLEALLSASPNVSTRQAAAIVGKPASTVGRYMSRMRQAS